ncbi:AraC-like DNA-binding protein [Robbsia andropogonis]|uniref:AraC family transcriptional regulator n=1 Tax=Robbsia andropogonis TaxID=28092 RepID=UPI003D23E353
MSSNADVFADWLLTGLDVKSTLFHMGQYCGAWRASTQGRGKASFHIILHGQCWLHLRAQGAIPARSLVLRQGDAVFLLSDIAHCLSSDPQAPTDNCYKRGTMTSLSNSGESVPESLGLACGFFEFQSESDHFLLEFLPDYLVARQDAPSQQGVRQIFELIRVEAQRSPNTPSPLIARLTSILFVYALRALDEDDALAPCCWTLLRHHAFAPLVAAIVSAPGDDWSTARMADYLHMSRATFCKRFVALSGQSPGQFVTLVRMKAAAKMLRNGTSTPDAAEEVGYRSESAFAQAFKRVTGIQPGVWRRGFHLPAGSNGVEHDSRRLVPSL